MAQKISYKVIVVFFALLPWFFLGCILIVLTFRFPLHDLNLWRLSMRYREVARFHPAQTEFIAHKTYLGGPWELDSRECIYAIGEFRRTQLSEREIRKAYKNVPNLGTKLQPVDFKIYFPYDKGVSMDSPIGDWFPEIRLEQSHTTSRDMKYLIYVAQENVFHWGDTRCLEW